jgi:hypothetical protein
VPGMKVTLSAAMRARDVSRPRDEQLAEAEAAEARLPSSAPGGVSAAGGVGTEGAPTPPPAPEPAGVARRGGGDGRRERGGGRGRG